MDHRSHPPAIDAPVQVEAERACYLVCVGHADRLAGWSTEGLDDRQRAGVRTLGRLGAVTINLPANELIGPEAEERLKDVQWVAPRAQRHEEIILEAMERSPVMPVRFGAAFRDDARVDALLGTNVSAIEAFLVEVEGAAEHVIHAHIDRDTAAARVVDRMMRDKLDAAQSPGARYLLERKIRRELLSKADNAIDAVCDRAIATLDANVMRRTERVGGVSRLDDAGRGGRWSLLVQDQRIDALDEALERLNDDEQLAGISFRRTGPLPPYSFCPALRLEG